MADQTVYGITRVATLEMPEAISAIAFSPDGTLLAVATRDKVHIYETTGTAAARGSSDDPE